MVVLLLSTMEDFYWLIFSKNFCKLCINKAGTSGLVCWNIINGAALFGFNYRASKLNYVCNYLCYKLLS